MKKVILFSIIVLSILSLTSCNKSDEVDNPKKKDLTKYHFGTVTNLSSRYSYKVTPDNVGLPITLYPYTPSPDPSRPSVYPIDVKVKSIVIEGQTISPDIDCPYFLDPNDLTQSRYIHTSKIITRIDGGDNIIGIEISDVNISLENFIKIKNIDSTKTKNIDSTKTKK